MLVWDGALVVVALGVNESPAAKCSRTLCLSRCDSRCLVPMLGRPYCLPPQKKKHCTLKSSIGKAYLSVSKHCTPKSSIGKAFLSVPKHCTPKSSIGKAGLSDVEEGDVEDECGEGLDGACGAGTVAEVVWNYDFPTRAGRHFTHGCDPTSDELVQAEGGWTAFLGLVEHLAVDQLAHIVDSHKTLRTWLRTAALGNLTVHHTVEHDLYTRFLSVFLKKLLIAELICIIYWWHDSQNFPQRYKFPES